MITELGQSTGKDAAAIIRTAGLTCEVITYRHGLFRPRWQTMILRGEVIKPSDLRPYGAFTYRSELTKEKILAIHNDVLDIVNTLGDEGADLDQAFSQLTLHLAIQRFTEKQVDLFEDESL